MASRLRGLVLILLALIGFQLLHKADASSAPELALRAVLLLSCAAGWWGLLLAMFGRVPLFPRRGMVVAEDARQPPAIGRQLP
jgi:hypothetical protein